VIANLSEEERTDFEEDELDGKEVDELSIDELKSALTYWKSIEALKDHESELNDKVKALVAKIFK